MRTTQNRKLPTADEVEHQKHQQLLEDRMRDGRGKTIALSAKAGLPSFGDEPTLLPPLLHDRGAKLITANGMRQRVQQLVVGGGIDVGVGAASEAHESLIGAYLNDALERI